jgi:hypothetical protein
MSWGMVITAQGNMVLSLQLEEISPKKIPSKCVSLSSIGFAYRFGKRDLASIFQEEVFEFLLSLTKNNKQATKRNGYSVPAFFYNLTIY